MEYTLPPYVSSHSTLDSMSFPLIHLILFISIYLSSSSSSSLPHGVHHSSLPPPILHLIPCLSRPFIPYSLFLSTYPPPLFHMEHILPSTSTSSHTSRRVLCLSFRASGHSFVLPTAFRAVSNIAANLNFSSHSAIDVFVPFYSAF